MLHLRHLAAAESSEESENDPVQAKAGSLIFFGNEPETATHVALATGGGEILHAQGWVRRGSLDKNSELFEPQLLSKLLSIHKAPV